MISFTIFCFICFIYFILYINFKFFYCVYICIMYIHSILRVAHNGKFVINSVYPGGGTMLAQILDFRLFKSLKNALSRIFCSPKLSPESWIFHCLRKNNPEYPLDITIGTSTIVYLIPQHFWFFKNYKLYWISNLFPALLSLVLKQ